MNNTNNNKKRMNTTQSIVVSKRKKIREGMVEHPGIGGRIADIIIILFLLLAMIACLIPMWHTLMASLSDGQQLIAHPGIVWRWITTDGLPNFGGYIKTITYNSFAILKSYGITLLYAGGHVIFGLVINVIAAYVLYRKPKMAPFLTLFILFTMMFNGGTLPTYMVIKNLGLTGTIWALLLPGCTNAMFVILTMNAFKQVAVSTVEAAEIDGGGHFTIMFKVLLPQSMGLITVTMINTAIISWNAWFEASIYVPSNRELWPLQLWIKQIVADNENIINVATPDWDKYLVSYSVILIATIPVLMVMPFVQKRLQKGSLMGAVKE